MKLSDLKTKEEFYKFADCWYQRAHNLRDYWLNDENPIEKRSKAGDLWLEMVKRCMMLTQIAIQINQPKPIFKKGSN